MHTRANQRRASLHVCLAGFLGCLAQFPFPGSTIAAPARDSQQRQRQERLFRVAVEADHVKGIRQIELIRPDILAVTIDSAITQSGNGIGAPGKYQKPEVFGVTSATDVEYRAEVHPTDVGRESFERFNGVADGPLKWKILWWHTYYLYLSKPLAPGHTYKVEVKGMGAPFQSGVEFAFDEYKTTIKAFKINQGGYSSKTKTRYTYLGWWAGDRGAVDYSAYKRFEAIDKANGKVVLQGAIEPRALGDADFSGENVYEMDIAALGPGKYRIHVPGLGCSESFTVGHKGLRDLYYHTMRAFFHQRCGQEFKNPWTWAKKPACHTEVWKSGHLEEGPGRIYCLWRREEPYTPKPGEEKRSFRGGYHDAADFDTFSYHLPAVSQFLTACEMFPCAYLDNDLNIPESGNGIPDILDEAAWGLLFFLENQNADGSVPMGRGNECDAFKQQCDGKWPRFGLLPCRRSGTASYAAVAAQFARLARPFDAKLADRHLASARKAYAWARSNEGDLSGLIDRRLKGEQQAGKVDLSWAATELYHTTGETKYHKDFLQDHRDKTVRDWRTQPARFWAYLICDRPEVDEEIRTWMLDQLRRQGDQLLSKLAECPYRMSNGRFTGAAWGSAQGVTACDLLLRLYMLTQEQKYLDAACLNADWHLGCNPASRTFITNLGYRHPNRPEISWFLYEGARDDMKGRTVKGIPIYGVGPALKWYDPPVPPGRSFRDVWGNGAEVWNEFTVHQCLGPTAMAYAVLYGLESSED